MARRDDFEITNTFVPARTMFPAEQKEKVDDQMRMPKRVLTVAGRNQLSDMKHHNAEGQPAQSVQN